MKKYWSGFCTEYSDAVLFSVLFTLWSLSSLFWRKLKDGLHWLLFSWLSSACFLFLMFWKGYSDGEIFYIHGIAADGLHGSSVNIRICTGNSSYDWRNNLFQMQETMKRNGIHSASSLGIWEKYEKFKKIFK